MPTRREETSVGNLRANKGEFSVSTISNCNLTINNDIDLVRNKTLWKNHRIMAGPKQLAAKVTKTATATTTTKTELEVIADLKKEQAKLKREIAYLRDESFVNNRAALVQE
mmetsp:Transcript_49364/g.53274  ORF Transcript_49364/g.53274 Transcript_49364/m.53274 type:complete len:111 (+) Transcript_49364:276-608(+)